MPARSHISFMMGNSGDEFYQFNRIVLHPALVSTLNLHGGQRLEAAENHHAQAVVFKAAKVEPVGPRPMKQRAKATDFRDRIHFVRVIVVSIEDEYQRVIAANGLPSGKPPAMS